MSKRKQPGKSSDSNESSVNQDLNGEDNLNNDADMNSQHVEDAILSIVTMCQTLRSEKGRTINLLIPDRVLAIRLKLAPSVEDMVESGAFRPIPGSNGVYVLPCGHLLQRNAVGHLEPLEWEYCSCCDELICPIVDEYGDSPSVLDVVYEAFIGPIPAGFAVMPLDRDQANCRLDNLVLVSLPRILRAA